MEQQWSENYRTIDGDILHRNVHDSDRREKRGNLLIVRAMRISSARLGLSGECDAVGNVAQDQMDAVGLHFADEFHAVAVKDAVDECGIPDHG